MTTAMELAPQGHTMLATRGPLVFSEDQRRMIRDSFANGASDSEFAVLMAVAEARALNPLLRQVHFVARWDSEKSRHVWTTQVSIDGLRAIAQRTGLYAGQDEPEFIENPDGTLKACKVKVYRRDWDRPAVGVAYFSEYVQTRWDKKTSKQVTSSFWQRMPHTMLAKCAESLAIRKAFPEDTSGLYTPEEMAQAENDRPEPEEPARRTTPRRVEVQPAQITPEGFAALGVEQPRRVLDAPAEPVDVVGDLRAQASRAESLSALAGLWIAAKADVAALDDRDAQERVWSAFKARARELGATVKALQAEIARQSTPPPPPDGTDGGPSKPRNAANDTATGDGTAGDAAPADGPSASIRRVESLDAVAERAASDPRLVTVRAHIATKNARPALVNSVRTHWSEVLADTDVRDLYAARLRATTATAPSDPRDDMQRDEDARALVTQWATAARDEAAKGEAA